MTAFFRERPLVLAAVCYGLGVVLGFRLEWIWWLDAAALGSALLAALILLFVGAGVWSVFGHLDTTVPAEVVAEGGSAVCYISSADAESVQAGMPVHVDDAEGTLGQMLNLSDRADTDRFAVSIDLPDGVYAAEVVTDSRKPIKFVLN